MYVLHIWIFIWSKNVKNYEYMAEYAKPVPNAFRGSGTPDKSSLGCWDVFPQEKPSFTGALNKFNGEYPLFHNKEVGFEFRKYFFERMESLQ